MVRVVFMGTIYCPEKGLQMQNSECLRICDPSFCVNVQVNYSQRLFDAEVTWRKISHWLARHQIGLPDNGQLCATRFLRYKNTGLMVLQSDSYENHNYYLSLGIDLANCLVRWAVNIMQCGNLALHKFKCIILSVFQMQKLHSGRLASSQSLIVRHSISVSENSRDNPLDMLS